MLPDLGSPEAVQHVILGASVSSGAKYILRDHSECSRFLGQGSQALGSLSCYLTQGLTLKDLTEGAQVRKGRILWEGSGGGDDCLYFNKDELAELPKILFLFVYENKASILRFR